MVRGESSRGKVRLQIQQFLLNGPTTSTKIVTACNSAKATVYKYLNELIEEGKVIWEPQRGRGKSTYELSNEAKDEIKLLVEKREIRKKIDQIPPEFLQDLNKLLDSLVKGEGFWVWPEGLEHSKEIMMYKAEKKILRQD